MDLWTAIKNRRCIRKFTTDPVEDRILKQLILEAGIWAPMGNAQLWRFIVVNNLKILNKIRSVSPGLIGIPSAVIVICQDLDYALKPGGEIGENIKNVSLMDTAMAAQNIMLAAHASGLGTCPVGSFNPEAIQKILGLPEHIFPQLLITVGIPGEIPPAPKRNLDVIWFNSYADK
jgi:nitroreductase